MDRENESILQVKNLSFHYSGVRALSDVSLSVLRGQTTGLIGPNGSGKSTFINLTSGVENSDYQGSIVFSGTDLRGTDAAERSKRGISRIFQGIRLFDSLTVEENVLLGAHTSMRHSYLSYICRSPSSRREHLRLRNYASEIMSIFGDRLLPRRDDQVVSLSYANRRRVELARALISDPDLLLLDEPMAGMNPHETEELTEQLAALRIERGMSMLLVEHKMSVIGDLSDRVYVLDAGECISEGSAVAVKNDERVLEAFLGRD